MKKLNRQTLLIGGAVACLLVALITLFSGSGSEASSTPGASGANAQTGDSLAVPSAESGGEAAETPMPNPEFYQRVRRQLLAITPEHQEPFVARDGSASMAPRVSAGVAGRALQDNRTLPVLPITVQPPMLGEPKPPAGSPLSEAATARSQQPAPDTSQPLAHGVPSTPRLRGQIHDRRSGKRVVLFELDGMLLRASNEPDDEWRIVKVEPRRITVRNGERILVLEVPYAP